MAETLETVLAKIQAIQQEARTNGFSGRPSMADDRLALAKRMDRAEIRRWIAD